jgi:RimJ/RimL family protein N-acetyltransferase
MSGLVRLRPVEERDLDVFLVDQLDAEAALMAAFTSRQEPEFRAHWKRVLLEERNISRTIEVGGEVAGNIGSFDRHGEREVGYWVSRRFWGQGVASAALAEFVARDELVRPLFAGIARHNLGSMRVAARCGFRPVRTEAEPSPAGDTIELVIVRLDAR